MPGERVSEVLFPRPAMPSDKELIHYGVRQSDLIEGWRRAGVLTSLASLERDEIYAKLLELPQRNPDGKLARPLYHWFLDASDIAIGESGLNYKEFLKKGRMWGRFGDIENYFPVSELHHADIEGPLVVMLSEPYTYTSPTQTRCFLKGPFLRPSYSLRSAVIICESRRRARVR